MINWIASYPKSGSTWVRLFLIAYQGPEAFDPNQRPWNHRQDTDREIYEAISPVSLDELTDNETRLMRGAVLVRHCRMAKPGPAYLKTHSANVVCNGLAWIPPEITSGALYIVRDPRDIAVSYADHLGENLSSTIERMGDDQQRLSRGNEIHQPLMSWSLHVCSWIQDTSYPKFILRYEDLQEDPEKWFREILQFFGFLFDEERFKKALKLTTFNRLQGLEERFGYDTKSDAQEKFFRVGKSGGWTDILDDEQASQVRKDHDEVMTTCGYQ